MDFSNIYWLDRDLSWFGPADGDLKADVVVVGAGMTGLSAAAELANHDVKTVVLEKRLLGTGASSRNAGFAITGPVEHYARAVKILGRDKARRLWMDSIEGIDNIRRNMDKYGIDPMVQENGSLLIADSDPEDEEVRETVKECLNDGIECAYIDRDALAVRLGTEAFRGACFYPGNFGFHPYIYVSGLAAALNAGKHINIYDNTELLAVRENGEDLLLETPNARIHASMLLIAANAWARNIDPFFEDKIIPVRGQVIATETLTKRIWNEVLYANFGYEYFRQLPGGELLIGGWRENMPGGDAFHYNEFIDDKAANGLQDYIRSKFPDLPNLKVTHQWAGTMGFSRDGLPLMGPLPGNNRIFTAAGFTGHGMAFGSFCGATAAKAIVDELDRDISMYYPSRFN